MERTKKEKEKKKKRKKKNRIPHGQGQVNRWDRAHQDQAYQTWWPTMEGKKKNGRNKNTTKKHCTMIGMEVLDVSRKHEREEKDKKKIFFLLQCTNSRFGSAMIG